MQIVYLSNRPEVLVDTVAAVEQWMPWVDKALVCAPGAMHHEMRQSGRAGLAGITIEYVADEEVTGRGSGALAAEDHQSRNFALRRALAESDLVDDEFLMSDDDYRPMAPIDFHDFVVENGDDDGGGGSLHQPYWFYRLEDWPGAETPYDQGQIRTLAACRLLDVGTLSFGAHMPQVIHREWFVEACKEADDVGAGPLLDEWSLYFNVAMARHPERFEEPKPFRTLAWPAWPHQWPLMIQPHPVRFENHYPEHEQPGGLFHGLPPVTTNEGALARISAWREAEIAIGQLRFDPAWRDPWTNGQRSKRYAMEALRMGAKVAKYLRLGTR